jgi:colanic acid/amylovoran biosynthesis glycosyltransferase
MKAVLVTNQFPKYSETFVVRQFLGLLELGWDMHVVCPSSDPEQLKFFSELQTTATLSRIHVTREFDEVIRSLDPDIVHFEFGAIAPKRMHIRDMYNCRTLVSFRGYDINYHKLDDPTYYDDVWTSADMLHFVGNDVAQRAMRRGCPPRRPWRVIPDAADVDFFTPNEKPLPRSPVDPTRTFRILSVGRLHWKKGYEFALEAVARLRDAGVPVEYRIIGDGDMRESVAFAIHDLELQNQVELIGAASREEVRDALRWADVFLHAAVSEGFCVSAIEAQAVGVPVVCSDADGLSENVADGETGFVVPRRNAAALSAAMHILATDERRRERMGEAGRRRAVKLFALDVQTRAFDDLYREMLRGGSTTPPSGVDDTRLRKIEHGAESLRRRLERQYSRQVTRHLIATRVPQGSRVLIVSRGDDDLLISGTHRSQHFPQDGTGRYAGHHPGDSAEAVTHLRELLGGCSQATTYIVFPPTSMWWLDHYAELRVYLLNIGRQVFHAEGTGAVYQLHTA